MATSNSVGHGGTNVSTHDRVDAMLDGDGTFSQGDDDGSGDRGRLLQRDSGEDTNHQTSNGVVITTKELTGLTSIHHLSTCSEKLETEKQQERSSSILLEF